MKTLGCIIVLLAALGCRAQERENEGANRIMGTGEKTQVISMSDGDRLRRAVRDGKRDEVAEMLQSGIDASLPDKMGATPLLLAARHTDDVELVRILLAAAPATRDVGDSLKRTPLSWAAGSGHASVCAFLLEHGAAVDTADTTGKTPLFHAVLMAQEQTARLMVAHHANVNVRDVLGDTPLMMAASKDNGRMVELLLEAGASRDAADDRGRTAALRARDSGVQKLLFESGPRPKP